MQESIKDVITSVTNLLKLESIKLIKNLRVVPMIPIHFGA